MDRFVLDAVPRFDDELARVLCMLSDHGCASEGDFTLRPDMFCLILRMGKGRIAGFRIVAHIVREFTLTLSILALFEKYTSSLLCLLLLQTPNRRKQATV